MATVPAYLLTGRIGGCRYGWLASDITVQFVDLDRVCPAAALCAKRTEPVRIRLRRAAPTP